MKKKDVKKFKSPATKIVLGLQFKLAYEWSDGVVRYERKTRHGRVHLWSSTRGKWSAILEGKGGETARSYKDAASALRALHATLRKLEHARRDKFEKVAASLLGMGHG